MTILFVGEKSHQKLRNVSMVEREDRREELAAGGTIANTPGGANVSVEKLH